jgi:phage minor structural protein
MIKIFNPTDKSFLNNGEKILQPIRAKVHKEDNGDYYIDVEAGIEYIDYIVQNNIIVAPTPTGEQAFRIDSVEKKKTKVSVKAWHVFYDAENYLIEDSYVVDKNCNDALDHLNNATDNKSPFGTISDITTIASFRCIRKSLYEAIQTVIERWSGHLVRDNFNIEIRSQTGQDNGVTIRYKKNLKDITCKEDWSNVVTKLMPVGKDGLLLDDKYIIADVQYDIPYTKTISFSQDIDEDNYQVDGELDETAYINALKEDLKAKAEAYIDINKYPKVNYTLSANIEKVTDIGDTVQVIDERLGIELLTNVISFEYDCIAKKYTQIEFGNFRNKLSDFKNSISSATTEKIEEETSKVQTTLQKALESSKEQILGMLGNSFVLLDGNQILIVDTLPREKAKNCMLFNSGGIAYSNTGINGEFISAWTIDGTFNAQAINIINLTASMIKGGALKLGGINNASGVLEIYDEAHTLIGEMTKAGFKMYGKDNSYVLLNNEVGFAGFDRNNNKIYWVDKDEFHQKKSVIEEEITLCNKVRFIPITIYDDNGNIINDGIGLVSTVN